MAKIFSILLIIIGLCLMLFFGYVLFIFSSPDKALILPFIAETTIFSIIFISMGLIVLIIGVVSILKTKPKPKKSSAE